MSVAYKPVGWNANKLFYDAALICAVCAYLLVFMHIAKSGAVQPFDDATIEMRAYGSCAFLMLSAILCIGPLARLDDRFLPLLYNRRHFGVATCAVAFMHARHVLAWYFAFSSIDPYAAVLSSNTSFGHIAGFPFELFGIAAFLVLLVLAATSHDFWLKFLTPPVWKAVHMAIYGAYACVLAHVAFGAMLTQDVHPLHIAVFSFAALVAGLHLGAARRQARIDRAGDAGDWIVVGSPDRVSEGRAIVVPVADGESVAIFRNNGRLSAIANACAHQNGPLGEGRIVDGCVTCPWHGFQYRAEDGCAPPPFTEKIATYNLRLDRGRLLLDARPNPPGTYVAPLATDGGAP